MKKKKNMVEIVVLLLWYNIYDAVHNNVRKIVRNNSASKSIELSFDNGAPFYFNSACACGVTAARRSGADALAPRRGPADAAQLPAGRHTFRACS